MKFETMNCPECGGEAVGTLERVQACAKFERNEAGELEYGEHETYIESGKTVVDPAGRPLLVCGECGDSWASRLLDSEGFGAAMDGVSVTVPVRVLAALSEALNVAHRQAYDESVTSEVTRDLYKLRKLVSELNMTRVAGGGA